jgi:hypothetical protein
MKKSIHRVALTWVAAGLVLTACGSSSVPGTSHGRRAKAVQAHARVSSANGLDPDSVAAVGLGKESGPIEVKFVLHQKLAPNQPAPVDVAIVPTSNLERVTVSFRSDDGLQVSNGGHIDPIEHPEPNVPITHTVTVVPDRDGIFNLTATVLIDTDTESMARAFSIPLIAGTGLPASDAAPASDAGHTPASR